jgi:hypothetical protein
MLRESACTTPDPKVAKMISNLNSNYKDILKLFNFPTKQFLSFEDCKKQILECEIKSQKEYQQKRKREWPSVPKKVYKDNWTNWRDFLGKNFLSFEDCKKEVAKHKFSNLIEYKKNRKSNWPSNPSVFYKDKWVDWDSFLGKEVFLSFEECRKEARKYKFDSAKEYKKNRKPNWPSHPNEIYKNEWISWRNFLGRDFVSFDECRKQVRKHKFKNQIEYCNNRKSNWPCEPYEIYKKEWTNWYDFLGKKEPQEFVSFKECRRQVRSFKFINKKQYDKNRRPHWPSLPEKFYKEWKSWYDFLGKKSKFR